MGFRNFELFGFDCSIEGKVTEEMKKETMETGQKKYLHVELNGYRFWTTGELLAMAQDCEKLFDNMDIDMNITFHGKGTLVSEVWKNSKRYSQMSYMEMMGVAA